MTDLTDQIDTFSNSEYVLCTTLYIAGYVGFITTCVWFFGLFFGLLAFVAGYTAIWAAASFLYIVHGYLDHLKFKKANSMSARSFSEWAVQYGPLIAIACFFWLPLLATLMVVGLKKARYNWKHRS